MSRGRELEKVFLVFLTGSCNIPLLTLKMLLFLAEGVSARRKLKRCQIPFELFFSIYYVFRGRNKEKIGQWEMWDKLNNGGCNEPHL